MHFTSSFYFSRYALSYIIPRLHNKSSSEQILYNSEAAIAEVETNTTLEGRDKEVDINTIGDLSSSSSIDFKGIQEKETSFEDYDASQEFVPLTKALLILVICIWCIGCLASLIILLCNDLARNLGVDQSTLGINCFGFSQCHSTVDVGL